jgi:hypothetical protein
MFLSLASSCIFLCFNLRAQGTGKTAAPQSRQSAKCFFFSRRNWDSLTPSPAGVALGHRVHTEWRLPISGVHPILMEKSALAVEGGGCTPTPFHPITITYKVAVYAPAERADEIHSFYFISTLYDSVGWPLACGRRG